MPLFAPNGRLGQPVADDGSRPGHDEPLGSRRERKARNAPTTRTRPAKMRGVRCQPSANAAHSVMPSTSHSEMERNSGPAPQFRHHGKGPGLSSEIKDGAIQVHVIGGEQRREHAEHSDESKRSLKRLLLIVDSSARTTSNVSSVRRRRAPRPEARRRTGYGCLPTT